MGMHQLRIRSRALTSCKRVRARLYSTDNPNPRFISTCYREDASQPGRRFLDALDTLASARTQPYVHDIIVTITYKRKPYTFRVFFKRHKMLRQNQAIRALAEVDIHGDVLLASVGKTVEIRNVRGGDECKAADHAVRKLMQSALCSKRRVPPQIAF